MLDRLKRLWKPERGSQEFKSQPHADRALVLSVTGKKSRPSLYQLRFLNRVMSSRERALFWGSVTFAIAAFAVGVSSLIVPHLADTPKSGGTFTEALVGSPKLVNPLFAPLNDVDRDLATLIYSGLFRLDKNLDTVPDLAESYRFADQGKTLEVHLRKDARFHDGTLLSADDVIFTYQSLKNWHSPLSSSLRDVKAVRVDDQTVQFQLPKPNPTILTQLTLGILPAHLWDEVTESNAQLADMNIRPVGSGPFKLASFTRDSKGAISSFELERFDAFYGTKPHLETLKFKFFPDRAQALQAIKNNQADALAFVPWTDAASVKNEQFRFVNLELPQETIVFFNVKTSALKDERVRKALAMAVDKKELQETVGAHVSLATSPLPFLDRPSSPLPDMEAARALLTSAGWTLKDGATVRAMAPSKSNASSTEFALSIDVPGQPDLLKIAEYLKRRWSLLGAKVLIHTNDAEPLLRGALANREYQILIWNVLLSPDQDLQPFWSSAATGDRGLNLSNIQDRDVDAALAGIDDATSSFALTDARIKLSDAITAHTPALFLARPAYAYIISKRVRGVTDLHIARPSDRLFALTDWFINTKWKWK